MRRLSEDTTISEQTRFRTNLGFAILILGFVAGLHPYAIAQIRGVVQQENRVVVLQQDARQDEKFNTLALEIRELTGEVRALREVVLSLKKGHTVRGD